MTHASLSVSLPPPFPHRPGDRAPMRGLSGITPLPAVALPGTVPSCFPAVAVGGVARLFPLASGCRTGSVIVREQAAGVVETPRHCFPPPSMSWWPWRRRCPGPPEAVHKRSAALDSLRRQRGHGLEEGGGKPLPYAAQGGARRGEWNDLAGACGRRACMRKCLAAQPVVGATQRRRGCSRCADRSATGGVDWPCRGRCTSAADGTPLAPQDGGRMGQSKAPSAAPARCDAPRGAGTSVLVLSSDLEGSFIVGWRASEQTRRGDGAYVARTE
jgi:hypothetical protein